MSRTVLQMLCAPLMLASAPAIAGGFHPDPVPINDTVEDIRRAAFQAERIAYRIDGADPAIFAAPSQPVVIEMPEIYLSPIRADAVAPAMGAGNGSLRYLGGLALLPLLFLGGGDGSGSGSNLDPGPGGGFETVSPTPAVPEPATWAMMLLGFGAIGAKLRRTPSRAGRGAGAHNTGSARAA